MPILSSPRKIPEHLDRPGHPWRSAAGAALLASLVLLPQLGHRVLTAWDEGIYAELAREMLAAHSWQAWVVPHWNGALWFEKPPLALWLMAVSMRLFGLTSLAARLPSALAGIVTVTALHLWLSRHFGTKASWLGTVLLLASFGFQHAARAGETDSLLTLFCLLGLIGLSNVLNRRPAGWLLFWAGLTCALLTKGAAALPLLLTPALLFLLPSAASPSPPASTLLAANRSRASRNHPTFLPGLLLCTVLAGAWPLALGLHFSHRFWAEFLGLHTLARASTALEGHRTSPLFYLWVLLVSAPPFALLYPFAAGSAWRRRASSARPLLPFLLFAFLELGLFSVARTRLPHYIAPVYPCASALLAVWLTQLQTGPVRTSLRSPHVLWPALAALFAAGTLATAHARSHLHTRRLPNGSFTPDNRESAALLQSVVQRKQPLPAGPLLVWHHNPHTPFTTDAFYSRRLVRQLFPSPGPTETVADRYDRPPVSTPIAGDTSYLLLLDRDLLPQLPPPLQFTTLAAGPHQAVGVVETQPATHTAH